MQRFIIVLALIVLLFSYTPKNVLDLTAEEIESYALAGLLAYLPADTEEVKPDPKPETECKCNKSTGKISYDGGTSWTDCPCKNNECKCGCVNSVHTTMSDVFPRVVEITDLKNCAPCKAFSKNVVSKLKDDNHKKSGWRVGNTCQDHLQILDVSVASDKEEIARLGLSYSRVPTFYLLTKDGSKIQYVGSMNYEEFMNFAKAKRSNPSLFGKTGTSHESRATLIDHLLNDGIHRGKYSVSYLNSLSDDQLNDVHERDHNGSR